MRRPALLGLLVLSSLGVACVSSCRHQTKLPEGCAAIAALASSSVITLTRVFPEVDVEAGIALTQRPDDDERWYLATQSGYVYTFTNAQANPSVFVDIRDALAEAPEAGLLGIAFHPQFASNGHVYRSYTTPGPGAFVSRIARYQSDDGGLTIDRSTEFVILELPQPYSNHNGGDIHFGPDGFRHAARRNVAYRRSLGACTTRGASASIVRPVTCGPATSANMPGRRSTVSGSVATMAGTSKRAATASPRIHAMQRRCLI
jgi:hypothetical protein